MNLSGIRAAGDAKYTMYASIVTSVVGRVAFSVFFAIVLNMGVIGIALAMVCDWGLKAVLIQHRYRSGKWKDKKVI